MPSKNIYMTAETIGHLRQLSIDHGYSHSESVRIGVADLAKKKQKRSTEAARAKAAERK